MVLRPVALTALRILPTVSPSVDPLYAGHFESQGWLGRGRVILASWLFLLENILVSDVTQNAIDYAGGQQFLILGEDLAIEIHEANLDDHSGCLGADLIEGMVTGHIWGD
jgi:hypothetical protein